jgi:hypothetical protein
MRDETGDAETKPVYERLVEGMRGAGVGTEDPNIVGDAGPTDVPPGKDPDTEWPPPAEGENAPPVAETPPADGEPAPDVPDSEWTPSPEETGATTVEEVEGEVSEP